MINGKLWIISSPSGAGKTCLVNELFKKRYISDNSVISISYTTRLVRSNEKDGKDYYFVTKDKFFEMIKNDEFLEYANIFGNYYGTSKLFVEHYLNKGINVFLIIDWNGVKQIYEKKILFKSIFILPPSREELFRRLCIRDQDSFESIQRRMKQSILEMSNYHKYSYVIINDDFNSALIDLESIIRSEYLLTCNQKIKYKNIINKLLEK